MQLVPRRILFVLIILIGLSWMFISRSKSNNQSGQTFTPGVGLYAPSFSLETITGDTISLADFAGQPVILNFWASWCPPCRAEMPALQAVYAEYQDEIIILAINASDQDTVSAVEKIRSDLGLEFPILMDVGGAVQKTYKISSLPTTYYISPDGKINKIEIGGPLTEASLRIWIGKMLPELP